MLFNSGAFLFVYLPLVFFIYWALPRKGNLAIIFLFAASLIYYSWDDPIRLGSLILFSMTLNYLVGRNLSRNRSFPMLTAGVTANLALLFYFKYINFAVDSVKYFTGANISFPDVVLPIGISFYTFTQIAFLVDAYRGAAKEYRPFHYGLFVTFFPHLIAGPILHHKEMIPQFEHRNENRFLWQNVAVGLSFFSFGLFKKMVLADHVQTYVSLAFGQDALPSASEAWIGALSYTLQLYFDFSGYSDMAIGLARMFGVVFPLNFNSPYKSRSIIDFWRRWHMTLSRFLRDYLYIPLGGNRGGLGRFPNLFLTMLLGGLWHGAGWTFVIWGALHGLYLIVNHGWIASKAKLGLKTSGGVFNSILAQGLTFLAVVIGWVFFRADTVEQALQVLQGMAGLNGLFPAKPLCTSALLPAGSCTFGIPAAGWVIAALLCIVFFTPNTQQIFAHWKPSLQAMTGSAPKWLLFSLNPKWMVVTAILLGICLASLGKESQFLYYRF